MQKIKVSYFKVFVLFGIFSITGIALIPFLNIKLNPQKTSSYLYINFQYPQASPQAIENHITSRLEGIAASIDGIEEIDSETSKGKGTIVVKINKNNNVQRVKLRLNAAIRQSWNNFPDGMMYPKITSQNTNQVETTLMSYKLTSNLYMPDIQRWIENELSPNLLKVDGAKNIAFDGIYNYKAHININKYKAENLGLSLEEIQQSITNLQKITDIYPLSIQKNSLVYQYVLRVSSQKNEIDELLQSPIKTINGKIIYLKDISQIEILKSERNARYRVNGEKCVFIRIIANENVNNLKLASRFHKFFKKFEDQIPENIHISLAADSTVLIKEELKRIGLRTLLTLLLIIGMIWFVYKDTKYIAFIIITFITNVSIACTLYYFLDIEIHFFAMAAITLSFGMMIDNSIIVIDYIKTKSSLKIIMPLFAATLTTVGALYIINIAPVQKEDFWYDFTIVIIINLSISLLSSIFLVPSLIKKYGIKPSQSKKYISKRTIVKINQLYLKYIHWGVRNKAYVFIVFILLFGIPFFALPEEINNKITGSKFYNNLFHNETFKKDFRPWIDKLLGGTLKPFIEHSLDDYQTKLPEENAIVISAQAQDEYSTKQLDSLFYNLEIKLKQFKALEQTEANLTPNKTGRLIIRFKEGKANNSSYIIYDYIVDFLQKFGGGTDWHISYNGLNTSITHEITHNKPWGFYLYGYDYEKLIETAQKVKTDMYKNPRVKHISILPENNLWGKSVHSNTIFEFFDRTYPNQTEVLKNISEMNSQIKLKPVNFKGSYVPLIISYQGNNSYYSFFNSYLPGVNQKLINLGELKEVDDPQKIIRHNQQYQLFIEYNYLSSAKLALSYQNNLVTILNSILPPGFSSETNFSRNNAQTSWILPIVLIIICIFFITSILFESVRQAIYILMIIPFSYIGVFITFWIFDIDFDQGGYASFILLGGATVNAAIYIINLMNHNLRKKPELNYLKAWNIMFNPILLTVISSILGFMPFIIGESSKIFWRAFASGTIGGLLFSLVTVILLLPLQLKRKHINSSPDFQES